ncbi:hypothetical protein ABZX75_05455 [Streptomyces sp. NPDC003038]|uniref:hypothetical protein n=1 Tax=unclassified Streptomyces TaxID=2593676 RepID=UPI0033BA6857
MSQTDQERLERERLERERLERERPEQERPAQERPEQERPGPDRPEPEQPAAPGPATGSTAGGRSPAATLELLALLAAGAADLALDQLRQTADRAQDLMRRSDLRELLTEGVVELRKRGELATRRAGAGPEGGITENYLETMARRAAEKAGRPRA